MRGANKLQGMVRILADELLEIVDNDPEVLSIHVAWLRLTPRRLCPRSTERCRPWMIAPRSLDVRTTSPSTALLNEPLLPPHARVGSEV